MIKDEHQAQDFCAQRADATAMERLSKFAELLSEENDKQNLVSSATLEQVWLRHFADSLQLLDHVPRGTGLWVDLGTGAGFPGMAIAIARPDHPVLLVESRKRRTEWLGRLATELGLTNVQVAACRIEALDSVPASVISARAFAPLTKLLSLSARFSTPSTAWLLPKGRSAAHELAEQPQVIQRMFHVEHSVTDGTGGILVGRGIPQL